jgi:recombination protein RecT
MANEVVEKKAGELAKQNGSLKELIKSDSFNSAVEGFFTIEANRKRFIQSAVNAITKTPKLATCDKMSFFGALMQLAGYGLNPDGRNAHLIPYGTTCTLVVDYKGFVTLALRCPRVSKVEAFVVYKNDHFRLMNGEVEHIVDDPWGDRGDVVGYYAVCQFSDGVKKYETMSKTEVDAVRKRSRAANNGPWVTDYDEMAKKTVFKRLSKWLPVTPELQDAIERDNEEYQHDNKEFNRAGRVAASDLLKKKGGDDVIDGELVDGEKDVDDVI